MSDFRKLQSILNEYYGQYMDFPNNKYQPNDKVGASGGYRKGDLPTVTPGQRGLPNGFEGTAPIEAEEEITGTIDKRKVIAMIDKAIEEAQQQRMGYCASALGKLREEIIG